MKDFKNNAKACSRASFVDAVKHPYLDGFCVSILRDKENGIPPTAYSDVMSEEEAEKLRDEIRAEYFGEPEEVKSKQLKEISNEGAFEVVDKLANLIAKFYDPGSMIYYLMQCEGKRFLIERGENGSYQLWGSPDIGGYFDLVKNWKGEKI